MRIVIATWRDLAHPSAGGSERYVDDIACGLLERGHTVTVLAGGPTGPRPYPVVDTGSTYGQYLRTPLVYARDHRHADLLVDVQNGIPFWSPLWRRGPKLCVVHHLHTDQWATKFPGPVAAIGSGLESHLFPRVYRHVPIVAVSPSTADSLVGIGIERDHISIVPNAVRPAPDPCPEHAEPLFVILGRLVPHKRVDLALELWDRVRPVTGGRLVIVGDGPERARLERLAGPDVTFLGVVDEETKHRVLGEAWLLVHPAMHEGWGIVVTEAGRQSTPTIGFDVPGVRDSVQGDRTGVLAPDADGLMSAWMALAADAPRRAELGLAAREQSMVYTVDRTTDLFEAACIRAVSEPSNRTE